RSSRNVRKRLRVNHAVPDWRGRLRTFLAFHAPAPTSHESAKVAVGAADIHEPTSPSALLDLAKIPRLPCVALLVTLGVFTEFLLVIVGRVILAHLFKAWPRIYKRQPALAALDHRK